VPRDETEVVVLQLVSLIKQSDVRRSGDGPDPESGPPAEPTCRCGAARAASIEQPGPEDLSDAGMSTVEYAVGTVAAAAFAAVLYQIVTGGSVLAGLTELINRAMSLF